MRDINNLALLPTYIKGNKVKWIETTFFFTAKSYRSYGAAGTLLSVCLDV